MTLKLVFTKVINGEPIFEKFKNLFQVKFLSGETEIDILNDSTDSLSSNPITAVGCGIGGNFAYRIPEFLAELHKENSDLVTTELITTAIDALQKETTIVEITGETHLGNYAWKIPELLTELHKKNGDLITPELITTAIDALQKETDIVNESTGIVNKSIITTYRGNYAWKIPKLLTELHKKNGDLIQRLANTHRV